MTTETDTALETEYQTICETLSNAMDAQDSAPAFSSRWQRAQSTVTAANAAREAWEAAHQDFLSARKVMPSVEAQWNL